MSSQKYELYFFYVKQNWRWTSFDIVSKIEKREHTKLQQKSFPLNNTI